MRAPAFAAVAGLIAGVAATLALTESPGACEPRDARDEGTLRGDGVLLAAVTGVCGDQRQAVCTIGDGTREIATEVVPAGIAQDCVAFNQYVGVGLPAVRGYRTGECFTYARVEAPPRLARRTLWPRHRCRAR